MDVRIVNKLSDIYCQIANTTEQLLYQQLYGISCYIDNSDISNDIYMKRDILEYYGQFSSADIDYHLCNNKSFKKILNG